MFKAVYKKLGYYTFLHSKFARCIAKTRLFYIKDGLKDIVMQMVVGRSSEDAKKHFTGAYNYLGIS